MADLTASTRPLTGVSLFFRSFSQWLPALALAAVLSACGGGGGGGSEPPAATTAPSTDAAAMTDAVPDAVPGTPVADNVLPVTVDRGTDGSAINIPFVSVTVCQPGTDNCRTIDRVLVDTGSYGLRLAASAVGTTVSLPEVVNAGGARVGECAQFASGWVWGSVRRADVRLAGERAGNIPVQIVADPAAAFTSVPAVCSRTGPNMGAGLGANGILGVGFQTHDCGAACVAGTAPGLYFACPATGCVATRLPLDAQVVNPVPLLAANNNGVALVLPPVPLGGARTLPGSLIFGIDTQANNRLSAETVYHVDSEGNFTTTYKGIAYPESFIDSGSNAIFFPDAAILACSTFYCPPTPLALSAVNTSATGVSGTVNFTVESIASVTDGDAAAHLGGNVGFIRSFDWGLPFFFGRRVFVAMPGAPTSRGPGPFWAY